MLSFLKRIFLKAIGLEENISKEQMLLFLCSNEALPSPMSVDEEQECLMRLENGDENAKAELIERNLRLVVYISKKFENTGVDLEDLISVGSIGLIKAVDTFDDSKGIRLSSYAARCIENSIITQWL